MATDPIRTTDDNARELARRLLSEARHGALGVLQEGLPHVSLIALAPSDGAFLTLVSNLAPHTEALRRQTRASLLIGAPGKGDPLAHPRMSIAVRAEFVDKSTLAERYLALQPKARLYIDFSDFHLVCLRPVKADLNGGFGKAYRLTASDLEQLII
jgi:putative heme iron utilization protein